MVDYLAAFVAYPHADPTLTKTIIDGVKKANANQTQLVKYHPWQFNDIPGNTIVSPILEKIDDSPFVIADITYLNLNVIYEIGFSIGSNKKTFLMRNSTIPGDKQLAQSVGIFDTLGYFEYDSEKRLESRLTSHIDETPLHFNISPDRKAPVYIVEPPTRTSFALQVVSRIKKARYRYRSFMPAEDTRLSAIDALRQVSCSSGVILMLQGDKIEGAQVHNIRSMFVAGLAHGMKIPTLILSEYGHEPPIDVRDFVKTVKSPENITERVAEFCPLINDRLQTIDLPSFVSGGELQNISIGNPTAENEMTTLAEYFLPTDQYDRALKGDANLVVGRKGSGKTALFISIRDIVRIDKRNIVVDLLPEGYQLLKMKEDILSYLSEGARQHLITAFWEYLIFLEVAYKLLEKDRDIHRFNHEIYDIYIELQEAYRADDFSSEGDFSERLLMLSNTLVERYKDKFDISGNRKLTSNEVTELVHVHDIRKLRDLISRYLEKKNSVWILFDNLDKGWSTKGIDEIDIISLRCLIDAGRKIERDMKRAGHKFRCIVFVRNDVYETLIINSSDYGKEMRVTLDWTEPDLLRELLRLRLISGLEDKAKNISFDQIWTLLCTSHIRGEESSSYIIERSLMRPRNVLKIFNHAKGFAINFSRDKISEDDFEKGLRAYSNDLVMELDRELTDVFPKARDLIYHFADSERVLDINALNNIIEEAGIPAEDSEAVVKFLLYYGVLGIKNGDQTYFIFDVAYNLSLLELRIQRNSEKIFYVVNFAFVPALGIISESLGNRKLDEPMLPHINI